jgi:hypothetical protein
LWREATDQEKSVYQQEYEAEKVWSQECSPEKDSTFFNYYLPQVEYERAVKIYHQSPAYQNFLASRNRSKIQGAVDVSYLRSDNQFTRFIYKKL